MSLHIELRQQSFCRCVQLHLDSIREVYYTELEAAKNTRDHKRKETLRKFATCTAFTGKTVAIYLMLLFNSAYSSDAVFDRMIKNEFFISINDCISRLNSKIGNLF